MTFKKLIITQLISSIVLSSPISEAAGINRSGVMFDETGQSSTNGQNGSNLDSFDSLLGGGSLGGIPIGGGLIGGGIGGGSGRTPANKSKITGLANGDIGLLSDVVTIGEDQSSVVEERFVQAPAPAPIQQSAPQFAETSTPKHKEALSPEEDETAPHKQSEHIFEERIITKEPHLTVVEEEVEPEKPHFTDFFSSGFTNGFF